MARSVSSHHSGISLGASLTFFCGSREPRHSGTNGRLKLVRTSFSLFASAMLVRDGALSQGKQRESVAKIRTLLVSESLAHVS